MMNRAMPVSFGEAVGMVMKHDVLDRVCNLDGDCFIKYEDQGYSGAFLYGFKILYALGAIAQYYRAKLKRAIYIRKRRVYLSPRNDISTLKSLELHNLFFFLLQVPLNELFKALFILVSKRNFRSSFKIVDGIVESFRVLSPLHKKRVKLQQSRLIPVREVLKYFVPIMVVRQLNYLKHRTAGERYLPNNQLSLEILAVKGMMSQLYYEYKLQRMMNRRYWYTVEILRCVVPCL
jgi:hypothetical protein